MPVTYCGNIIGGVYLYKYDTEQAEILLGLQSNLRNITLVVCVFAVLVSVILSRMMTRRMNDLLGRHPGLPLGQRHSPHLGEG